VKQKKYLDKRRLRAERSKGNLLKLKKKVYKGRGEGGRGYIDVGSRLGAGKEKTRSGVRMCCNLREQGEILQVKMNRT